MNEGALKEGSLGIEERGEVELHCAGVIKGESKGMQEWGWGAPQSNSHWMMLPAAVNLDFERNDFVQILFKELGPSLQFVFLVVRTAN